MTRISEDDGQIMRRVWVRRIFFSLMTGFLFGLLIPTWEDFNAFTLTLLISSGVLILGLALRDFLTSRAPKDKPEGR